MASIALLSLLASKHVVGYLPMVPQVPPKHQVPKKERNKSLVSSSGSSSSSSSVESSVLSPSLSSDEVAAMSSGLGGLDLLFAPPGERMLPFEKRLIPTSLAPQGINQFSSLVDTFYAAVIGLQESHSHQAASPLEALVPSGQPQLPTLQRIAKMLHEESFPWFVAFSAPSLFSLVLDHSFPLYASFAGELAFLAFCSFRVFQFAKPTQPQPRLPSRTWDDLYHNVWNSHPDQESRRSFLMGWFYDAPFEDLCREDALTFLAWMKYGLPLETGQHLTKQQKLTLELFDLPELERQVNSGKPLPTRNERMKTQLTSPIRFNLEPLRYRHKPLVFYAVTHGAFYWLRHKLETQYGFVYHKAKDPTKDLSYWYRAPTAPSTTSPPTPLVFVHGVGGLPFYFQLIADIVELIESSSGNNTPILLLDLPFVSLRMYNDLPAIASQIDSVCNILDSTATTTMTTSSNRSKEKVKATFVGHSFGSIVLSWMVQCHPDRVASCVFMDPICFQIHLKQLLFNFHMKRVDKRHQRTLDDWVSPFSLGAIINLAGSEMHTNNAMLRHFWWSSNALWPADLEKSKIPATILLSAKDDIVPTKEVAELVSNFNNDPKRRHKTFSSHELRQQQEQQEQQPLSWDDFFADLSLESEIKSTNNFFVKAHILEDAAHGAMVLDETNRRRLVDVVETMMKLNTKTKHS